MKLSALTVLTLLSINLSAQHWAPDHAKWHYKIQLSGFCVLCTITYLEVEVTGDTLINGQQCKILTKSRRGCIDDYEESYTYADSGRVYWYNDVINDFTLLYDFNANPNDSWEIMIDTCSLLITVDSVGTKIINGDTLKTLYISDSYDGYSGFFTGTIIETIGNPWYMFPLDLDEFCYGFVCDGDFLFGLNCYEDSIIGFYETGLSNSCDTSYSFLTISTEDKKEKISVEAIPNPFYNSFQIELEQIGDYPYYVNIFTMTGKPIYQGQLHEQRTLVDLGDLTAGAYYLTLFNSDKTLISRKLLIKQNAP